MVMLLVLLGFNNYLFIKHNTPINIFCKCAFA